MKNGLHSLPQYNECLFAELHRIARQTIDLPLLVFRRCCVGTISIEITLIVLRNYDETRVGGPVRAGIDVAKSLGKAGGRGKLRQTVESSNFIGIQYLSLPLP